MIIPRKIIFWVALMMPFSAAAVYIDGLAVIAESAWMEAEEAIENAE